MLKIYNTLRNSKEDFTPIDENLVKMYTCGPTVYDFTHIGNFRTFVFEDVFRRCLKYFGYNILQVMNITDVDDKTIRGSLNANMNLSDYTKKYTDAFFDDLEILNIEKAENYPRATDYIPKIVSFIENLQENDFVYESDGSYYFSISKFHDYGKLSDLDLNIDTKRSRVSHDEYSKEEINDFVVWKNWTDKDGSVFWETELGKGRPGWHIECSVMSTDLLGKHFDLHIGGKDLIFPHHENEIAQSESLTGEKFVNYWLHVEHLIVEGKKMSKSAGNFYTLRDIMNMGFDPLSIRFLLLSSHYRSQLNFTFDGLKQSTENVNRLKAFYLRIHNLQCSDGLDEKLSLETSQCKSDFDNALEDDINTPLAISKIFEFIRNVNRIIDENSILADNKAEIISFLEQIDIVFGVISVEQLVLTDQVKELISLREKFRLDKKWEESDDIRSRLLEMGYIIEDTKYGPIVKHKPK